MLFALDNFCFQIFGNEVFSDKRMQLCCNRFYSFYL